MKREIKNRSFPSLTYFFLFLATTISKYKLIYFFFFIILNSALFFFVSPHLSKGILTKNISFSQIYDNKNNLMDNLTFFSEIKILLNEVEFYNSNQFKIKLLAYCNIKKIDDLKFMLDQYSGELKLLITSSEYYLKKKKCRKIAEEATYAMTEKILLDFQIRHKLFKKVRLKNVFQKILLDELQDAVIDNENFIENMSNNMIEIFYYFDSYFMGIDTKDYLNLFDKKKLNKTYLELIEVKIKSLDKRIKDINSIEKDNDEIEKIKDSLRFLNLQKKNWIILGKTNFFNFDEKNIILIKSIIDQNVIKDKFLNTNLKQNFLKKIKINEEFTYYYKKSLYYTFGLTLFLMFGFLFFIYLVIAIKKTKIL